MNRWDIVEMLRLGGKRREVREQLQVSGFDSSEVIRKGRSKLSEQYGKGGVSVLVDGDDGWPYLLKEIPDSPVVLFYKGKLPEKSKKLIAVVGSRKISERGIKAIRRFVPELVERGIGIVSGLARGVDSLAHEVALECGGYTLAVLPTPFDKIYPPENESLIDRIVLLGGCVLTEYPLDTGVERKNFLERNRIVSGLCYGTLVIEAAARSGSIATPNFAIDQGREVWVVPALQGDINSEGVIALIEDGARPIGSIEDILYI